MQIELIFRHKWMRKLFQKKAGELSYVYGKDVVVNAIKQFCFYKLLHEELQKELNEANEQSGKLK
jgi:hypothetical protein